MSSFPHKLGAVIMMKNESATIDLTIKSVLGTADCVCCYDTGSTDDTVERVEQLCKANNLPLYLLRGLFVDFSTSRNVLIEFAEKHCEYQLHLDSADILKGGAFLKQFVKEYSGTATSFMMYQQWYMGGSSIRFRNFRLVKSGHGYRYKCRVHEILVKPDFNPPRDALFIDVKFDERPEIKNSPEGSEPLQGTVIFQNRTLDNTKTLHRFQRDVVMLYEDWEMDPEETRTLFYLAQTFDHMGDNQRGYTWYQKRLDRANRGFNEEVLHSHMRCGKLAARMEMDTEIVERHYWNAIEFSMKHWKGRVMLEPAILLVEIMVEKRGDFTQAYHLLKSIIDEPFPVEMNLFVEASSYTYARYHWMGRVGWYVSQHAIGGWCALIAYRAESKEIDLENLQRYLEVSPHQPEKWKNEDTRNHLVKNCPNIAVFERAWVLGEIGFPVLSTSVEPDIPTPPGRATIASLTGKQKFQKRQQQQRLMRKAK